jgi:hypothetical protein
MSSCRAEGLISNINATYELSGTVAPFNVMYELLNAV